MKRTRLRSRSKKATAQHAEYLRFVGRLAAESDICEVCPIISRADPGWRGCTHYMQGLHHLRKRSAGGDLMDPANVLRSCNNGNGWVEDHPKLAKHIGLTIPGG